MSKRSLAKYKADRSLGVNLWGRPKSPYNARPFGPGAHGKRGKKLSSFGTQLLAKQRLRFYYGNITERQFVRYYQEASRLRGDTSEHLIGLLERRLDAVVYRMKFAATPFAARQLINHRHILVNGKGVNIASYLVREGDVISVRDKSQSIPSVIEASASQERDIPDYLEVDTQKFTGQFKRTPKFDEVPYAAQMEPNLVIEYYSR